MKKKNFNMPTSFTVLLIITVIVAILTFIIPAGKYQYENGIPIAGTYEVVERNPQGIWDILSAPINGFTSAISIIVFILVLGGFLGITFETKAIDAGLSGIMKKLKGRESLIIPIVMFICALGGTTYGMAEETIAFYPIIVPILLMSGYDVITGVMTIFIGAGIGVCASTLNPFAVGIASGFAEVSIGDGILHRLLLLGLYFAFSIFFVMRYARKVKKNPEKSIVFDIKDKVEAPFKKVSSDNLELTKKRKLVLAIFGITFLIMVIAIIPWKDKFNILLFENIHNSVKNIPFIGGFLGHIVPLGDWYFSEMTTLFFLSSLIVGIVYSYNESKIVSLFIVGAKDLLSVALILGVAKGISIIMTDGMIIDTVLHFGENLLSNVNKTIFPILVYLLYIPMAFLIPSTSGLATATIPILAPLSDFVSVGRDLIVTAMSAGSGTMNLFSPTQVVLVGALTLANIPYIRWLKHIILFVVGMIAITIGVLILASIFNI